MARDLGALVELLGAEQIDLVGYSMGAIVALLYASAGARVRRLVVGGVGSGVIECGGVDRRIVSNESILAALSASSPRSSKRSSPPRSRSGNLADARGADREALLAQARSIHRGGVAPERIAAPTLVLAGDADPLASRPEVLVEAIPGARLELLEGDHMSVFGDPRLAVAICEFLAA